MNSVKNIILHCTFFLGLIVTSCLCMRKMWNAVCKKNFFRVKYVLFKYIKAYFLLAAFILFVNTIFWKIAFFVDRVPQGSILVPILFLIYLHINWNLTSLEHLLLNNKMFLVSALFIPIRNGRKKLLMINQYTYCFHRAYSGGGARWLCSMRLSRKCTAHVRTKNELIMHIQGLHTHEPPRYHVTETGEYVKVWLLNFSFHLV